MLNILSYSDSSSSSKVSSFSVKSPTSGSNSSLTEVCLVVKCQAETPVPIKKPITRKPINAFFILNYASQNSSLVIANLHLFAFAAANSNSVVGSAISKTCVSSVFPSL